MEFNLSQNCPHHRLFLNDYPWNIYSKYCYKDCRTPIVFFFFFSTLQLWFSTRLASWSRLMSWAVCTSEYTTGRCIKNGTVGSRKEDGRGGKFWTDINFTTKNTQINTHTHTHTHTHRQKKKKKKKKKKTAMNYTYWRCLRKNGCLSCGRREPNSIIGMSLWPLHSVFCNMPKILIWLKGLSFE